MALTARGSMVTSAPPLLVVDTTRGTYGANAVDVTEALLRQDVATLNVKLVALANQHADALATNDRLVHELNILTEQLFVEANSLVSAEARRR